MGNNCERSPELETAIICTKEKYIRDSFLRVSKVTDFKKGYISVPFVNQLIDPTLQKCASELISYEVNRRHLKINKIVQIPYSGNPLAASVAENLKIPLVPGRKGAAIPGAWDHPLIIEELAPSFTTGEKSSFVFNGLEPGDKVLLVDDVIALGDTSSLIINKFKEQKIEVLGFAVYFAKLFQSGVKRIFKETGINPFFVVGIKNISPDGQVTLCPPHF